MNVTRVWLALLASIGVLFAYEAVLALAQRRQSGRMARSAHTVLREEWFHAVSQQASQGEATALPSITPRLVLELMLRALLFESGPTASTRLGPNSA